MATPSPKLSSIAPITIATAADAWLHHLETRKRHPIKPATYATFQSYLRSRIVPAIGHLAVASVGVAVLRSFIEDLAEAGLADKTQVEIAGIVKQIIASVCDKEGESLFPRNWSNEKLDLPVVNCAEQYTPMIDGAKIETAIAKSDGIYPYLFALAAGSGMRIGELRGIKLTEDGISTVFDPSTAMIHVRRSVWRRNEQSPKTTASVREVLIPYNLSSYIARWAGNRTGFLFGDDAPICESTARLYLTKQRLPGFHAFRRFFISHRRSMAMPNDIIKALVGHASSDITDRYSHFGRNPAYAAQMRAEVERCGLGFALPDSEATKLL